MSIWRLASKGGSPSLPHPLLLYTSAPDPFAGGAEGAELFSLFIFSGFVSSPRHKKCPHFFFLKNVFTYCWMRQLLGFDSEFTRSVWLPPTWHSLAFGTLFATDGQHDPGIQNTCLCTHLVAILFTKRDIQAISSYILMTLHWQTTLPQSYSRNKPPDVVRPEVHQGKVVKIRKRWQFFFLIP
jgi:hypothetical protein